MKREFLTNIFFLLFINLLIKPFYLFGIDRGVQNAVGTDEYGMYFVLLGFTYLFQIFNDFGLQNYNSRNISQYRHLLPKYFPNLLLFKLIMGLVFLFILGFSAWLTDYIPQYTLLLFCIAINQILVSLIFFLRSNIVGLGYYRTDAIVSILDKVLMILICGALLWGPWIQGPFQLMWFVYAQMFSLGLTGLLAFFWVYGKLPVFRFKWQPAFLLLILKESYPYGLVVFLMTIYTRIDSVMLEKLLPDGKFEAGVYASAYRILDASNMIGFLFAGLLLPMFARMLKIKERIEPLVESSLQMIWTGAITLCVVCYFFQENIMLLLYNEATVYWGEVLGYLMISFIAVSGTYIFGTLLTANDSMKQMNFIFIISILLNIVLNAWLIPTYKASGAAIATSVTQSFAMLAQVYLAVRILHLQLPASILFRVFIFSFGLILISYGVRIYIPVIWWWQLGSILALAGGLALVSGMLSPRVIMASLGQGLKSKSSRNQLDQD